MMGWGYSKIPQVTVDSVKEAIDKKEENIILDVRTPQEYTKARIAQSINIPVDEIEKNVRNAIPDQKKKIYVYCLSGSRSIVAAEMMVKMGYTNVFDVSHGLLAWRIKKYPLEET